MALQVLDHFLHQDFRGRRTRRNRYGGNVRDPLGPDVFGLVNQVRVGSQVLRDFDQPVGVGAVARSNDQHHVRAMGHVFDCRLTVLGRVADVLGLGPGNVWELLLQGLDHVLGLIQRERGLGQVGDLVRIGHNQRFYLFDCGHDLSHIRGFALRAFDLFVVAMADQHQGAALARELDRLEVHLGDQRAGCIDDLEPALLGPLTDRRGNTMRGVDHARTLGHLIQLVNEDGALLGEIVYNVAVVNDFLADVDRRTECIQRNLHYIDRTHHARAKAARLEKKHPFAARGSDGRVNVEHACVRKGHIPSIPAFHRGRPPDAPLPVHFAMTAAGTELSGQSYFSAFLLTVPGACALIRPLVPSASSAF